MKQIARRRRWIALVSGVLVAYRMLAYIVLPALWTHHEHELGLAFLPMVTRNADGIPGDALNVGRKEDIFRIIVGMYGLARHPFS